MPASDPADENNVKDKMPNEAHQIDTLQLLSSNIQIDGHHIDLYADIRQISRQQLQHAMADVSDTNAGWELFVADGDLKMFKLENEIEGIAVDPLKALHSIDGVTAREFIDLFFSPEIKKEWDDTIESCSVIEQISPNTMILHQVHKRIWPAAVRESLFWSQRLNISAEKSPEAYDAWMVCNQSIEIPNVKLSHSSAVRVKLTIAMICQTVLKTNKPLDQIDRDDVRCKITYVAEIHPGGWVPKIGVRQVYKKEYPKFLRTFSAYVHEKVKDKQMLSF